jgi:hypothetical protein
MATEVTGVTMGKVMVMATHSEDSNNTIGPKWTRAWTWVWTWTSDGYVHVL